LKDLEFLGIRAVELEEVQEVVGDEVAVDIVLWPAALEEAESFGEVVVEDDGLVTEFADQEVFLFDFLLEGLGAF
jgi:hypothetical protein